MSEQVNGEQDGGKRRPRAGKPISFESAIFLFAFLSATSDKTVIEQAFRLALREPDLLRPFLCSLAASQGVDLNPIVISEPTAPASRDEVKALTEPLLRKGAEVATLAQLTDIYLFDKERTPENIVYAFYTGIRYAIAGEREPTKEESARIWEIALLIARSSKIGDPHWKELESQGSHRLEDWIDERKEAARKKYKTFLSQKKRAEATAQRALESLMSDMFGDGEGEAP